MRLLGPRECNLCPLAPCIYSDNQLTIAREGGLPFLVGNLSAESERAQRFAAAALQSLSHECTENQLAPGKVGAIEPLVVLLGSESPETQLYARKAHFSTSRLRIKKTARL